MRSLGKINGKNTTEVKCSAIPDEYGYVWGDKSEYCGAIVEISLKTAEKRFWERGRDIGITYGVICPKCQSFTPIHGKYIKLR